MAEKLTNEQQAAVDSRGRSLLVSAAAGSRQDEGARRAALFLRGARRGEPRRFSHHHLHARCGERSCAARSPRRSPSAWSATPATTICGSSCCASTARTSRRWTPSAPRCCARTAICSARTRAATRCGPISACWTRTRRRLLRERVLARTLDDFYDRAGRPAARCWPTRSARGATTARLRTLVLELHAKLQAQPYDGQMARGAARALARPCRTSIEDTPYGKILLNEVRRKARHWQHLLQRAAQEMSANDALNQKYAPRVSRRVLPA